MSEHKTDASIQTSLSSGLRLPPSRHVQVFSGKLVPLPPKAQDISIFDIAHALAHTCRYNGHTRRFYSVAEHSILLACARQMPRELEMQALLHDAAEAYLGDIVAPLKALWPGFAELEAATWKAIAEKFDLPEKIDPKVRELDLRIVKDEQRQVLFTCMTPWELSPLPALEVKIKMWTPAEAKAKFIETFLAVMLQKAG